jgi:hypothetical protein
MRGVHRKVEESPRWTPTLTPIQTRLRRRLNVALVLAALAPLEVALLDGLDADPVWWWAGIAFNVALGAVVGIFAKALGDTGPPFRPLKRWWWPWGYS